MKNKTLMKTLSALLAVVMVLCSAPLSGFVGLKFPEIKLPEWNLFDFSVLAKAKTYSGTCGENITWSIDSETGVLDITGTGDMPDFSGEESAPWSLYRLLAKTVNISDGITNISEYAFYDFANLVDVNIPDSVTNIYHYAFYGCISLKTITIPAGVTYIDNYAFEGCKNLEEFLVNSANDHFSSDDYGVLYDKEKTSLRKYPVANTRTEFKIPDSVNVIEYEAFANCENLITIIISQNTEYIWSYAFSGCTSLASITIPDGIVDMGSWAFANCTNLKELNMPASLAWGEYDNFFYGCTNIEKVTLTKGTGKMPDYSEEYSYYYNDYEYMYSPWYISRDTIKEIVIEDGVKNIGEYAFYGCTNLETVILPNTITEIGYNAFCGCENLNSITLNEGITNIGSYAFQYCSSLEEIIFPDTVTGIGYDAFYGCTNLKSVTIPKNVKNIGSSAFGACANLENVYYKGDITSWCSIAFDYESSNPLCFAENFYINNVLQTDLVIPDSIVEIKDYAFYGYKGLNTVAFSDELISINDYSFRGCSNLTTVTLPDSVMKIGENAFANCSSLSTVYYDGTTEQWKYKEVGAGNNNLTKNILFANDSDRPYYTGDCGDNLKWTLYTDGELVISGNGDMSDYSGNGTPWYEKLYGIKKVTVEDGVTSIGDSAFKGLVNLEEVSIADSVTSIGKSSFRNCVVLGEIIIPNSVKIIDYNAFENCSNLSVVKLSDNLEVVSGFAFSDCTSLNEIILPETVTSIGECAFQNCTGLTEIIIPDSVTSVSWSALHGCTGLKNVVIGKGITSIGSSAFAELTSLKQVVIPDSVTSIGYGAFHNCTSITEISIPNSVTKIENNAFYGCTSLKKLIMPVSVQIYFNSFGNCTNIENVSLTKGTGIMINYSDDSYYYAPWYISRDSIREIIIEDGVTNIGTYAFCGCSNLTSIDIPDSVTSIGQSAFSGCSSLTSIDIPDGVTDIGDSMFRECSNLTLVDLPDGVTDIGNYTFYNCSALTSIDIPDNVTSIGQSAFSECSSLGSIVIPDSITTINNYTFYNCSNLMLITIPDSVTSIGYQAFYGCNNLKYVGYSGTAEDWNSISFGSYNMPIRNARRFYETNSLDVKTVNGVDYCVTDNEAIVLSYSGNASQVTILEKVDDKLVVEISNNAFKDKTSITNITIPDTVTYIGSCAFANCSSIKSIVIPKGVIEIGSRAFAGMTSLEELTVPFAGRYKTPSGSYHQRNLGWFFNWYYWDNAPENAVYQYDYYYDIPETLKKVTITNAEVVSGYTFRNCWFIEEVSINDSAAGIGKYAFSGCTNLKKVNIPQDSPLVGQRAFYGCENLSEIVLNDTIETIGNYVFADCSSLKVLIIPDSVTQIGYDILSGATNLESLTIPFIGETQNSEAELKRYVFDYRIPETLKTVNITNETSIVKNAFADSKIETITLNEGIKTIGVRAFANCTELKEITIPDSVENIQDSAFYNCSSMKTVNLGNNANMSMDYDVFNGCNSVESFTIGSSNVNYCTDTNGVLYNKNKTGLIRYPAASSMTEYTIAPTTAYINEFAFENSYNLKKVNFPENMMSVGAYAFRNCTALEEVHIPDGANTICHYAFNGCTSVKKVILPESLIVLGGYAFGDCVNLSEVIINCANLEDANSYPFYRCGFETDGLNVVFTDKVQTIPAFILSSYDDQDISNVAEITIGKIVTSVGSDAFYGNANLTKINFNATDCTFVGSAFSSCSSLTEVNIASNVKRVPEYFVANCDALTDVTIPESVTEIGKYAFSNCENLENVVFLGKNKIDIDDNIFDYSPKATICCKENSYMHSYADINVIRYCIIDESNNPNYEIKNEVLISYKGNAENIYLNSVNRIGFGAFAGNTTLKHIELSNGIDRIYDMAFNGCTNLSTVIIPKSVTSIGSNAFGECDKLTIYCYAGSYAETYAKEQGIKYEYITLDLTESKVEMYSDEVFNLGTSYSIDLVDKEEVMWASDDESIIKVAQNGKITAVSEGTATVIAKTESGLEAECTVTVNAGKRPIVEGVTVSDFSVNYKGTTKIEPDVKYVGDIDYTFEYSSSNESVATVDKDGNVTATGTGEAEITITVTDEYGNVVEDICKVTVSYAWWQWLIIIFLFGWIWY